MHCERGGKFKYIGKSSQQIRFLLEKQCTSKLKATAHVHLCPYREILSHSFKKGNYSGIIVSSESEKP